jgi:predicted dehydrogenase
MARQSTVDRRNFLKTTAATTVATAAFGVWTETAAAQNDSPGETITLGVMGINGRGSALAKGFAGIKNARVAYLCDVDERAVGKNMDAFEDLQSRKPEGVKDFRRILEDRSIDCLVVAAPDHWHGPATILGCSAGKHVYVEKPACHNPREGEIMVEAARKHKRVVQMGNQRRSSPDLQAAIKRVQDGELGRVLFARGWINSTRPNIGYGKPAPVPEYLDYTLWQGPAPDVEFRDNIVHYNWHWFWHWGTGELGNNGIHALDVCRWGLEVDYPKTVTCGGGKFHFDDDQQTPDTQIVTYNFGDKAINWEHRTWNKRGFEGETFGIVFYGEKRNMVITRNITIYDMGGKELEKLPVKTGDSEHFNNFLSCVRSGERPNSDIEEGVKSTLLCHLGNIAYRTGQTVNFDPQQKKIVDNPEQTKLWSRQYRPGWEPKV